MKYSTVVKSFKNLFSKLFLISFFLFLSTQYVFSEKKYQKGSGKELDGNIVVISIFADDINTAWSPNRIDVYTNSTSKYMEIATDWIVNAVKPYGVEPKFYYDYFKYGGIYYKTKFNIDMTNWRNNDAAVWDYIEKNINLNWIKSYFKTDNFFFMVYLNTPKSSKVASATRSYYDRMPYPYEIVYIYRYRDNWECSPSSYAHEILHIFGAKDLYYADDRNGFSKEYIEDCKTSHKNDIMRTISDAVKGGVYYDKITNELSAVDAYYLGLINRCAEVRRFNLPKSEYVE